MQNLDDLKIRLGQLKALYGDKLYDEACSELKQILGPEAEGSDLIKSCLETLTAAEEGLKEPSRKAPKRFLGLPKLEQNEAFQVFAKALVDQRMLKLGSQAQYDAFEGALYAFCALASKILSKDTNTETEATILGEALTALRLATDLTNKIREVPEAAAETSKDFIDPPKELVERDLQAALLAELDRLDGIAQFNSWYSQNRERIDRVVSYSLRNELYDAIRLKVRTY